MIKEEKFQIKNGTYYASWQFTIGRRIHEAAAISRNEANVAILQVPQIRTIIRKMLKDFMHWRKLSIEQAGKEIYLATHTALYALNKLEGRLSYAGSQEEIKRLIQENVGSINLVLPKVDNIHSNALKDLREWAHDQVPA